MLEIANLFTNLPKLIGSFHIFKMLLSLFIFEKKKLYMLLL